jgi:hypothetical protein
MSSRLLARAAGVVLPLIAALALAAPASAHHPDPQPGPEIVVDWNRATLDLLATPGVQPATVHPTRTLALVHVAMHDAINVIDRQYEPYLVRERASGSPEAAAIAAAHGVLTALYPSQRAALDARRAAGLAALPDTLDRRLGVAIGEYVAEQIVAHAADDGTAVTPPVLAPGTAPGEWRPTPPAFAAAPFTQYPQVRPFVLRSASQYRVEPPPPLSGRAYAAALAEVRDLGSATSTTRTTAQTDAARFWSGPIQIYWNTTAQTVAVDRRLPLARAARLFALMDLTLADSAIAFYDSKYHYRLWRPVTALRESDPTWTPLLNTPADPSYPGAHSVLSAAGAEVLKAVFGRDIPITVTSPAVAGATRSFASASAAADEAGLARMWGGVHFRFDDPAGQRQGRAVARFIADRELEPR